MNNNPNLLPHEWAAVVVIVSFLLVITMTTYFQSYDIPDTFHDIPANHIEVTVEGAVENPGTFSIKKEATFEKLLAKLILTKDADISGFKNEKKLRHGSTLRIPSSEIQIYVLGAVENPRSLIVPKGTRLCDLLPLITVTDSTDIKIFSKKKKLKDQEVVIVNYK